MLGQFYTRTRGIDYDSHIFGQLGTSFNSLKRMEIRLVKTFVVQHVR